MYILTLATHIRHSQFVLPVTKILKECVASWECRDSSALSWMGWLSFRNDWAEMIGESAFVF